MFQRFLLAIFAIALLGNNTYAQDAAPDYWFNLDAKADNVQGLSVEKAYNELLKGKTSETVIVAVIDSGVDPNHEDLKDVMWVNEDEIAGNGIDDDNNGYIDDIHGWNFIGGAGGKNVSYDTYEFVRLYRDLHKIYKDRDESSLSKKERKQYATYQEVKAELEKKRSGAEEQKARIGVFAEMMLGAMTTVKAAMEEDTEITLEGLEAMDTEEDEALAEAVQMLMRPFKNGATEKDLKELESAGEYFDSQLNYHFNPDFDSRAEIVGDNYRNGSQRNYGNNDVQGPDAGHGTHVAGIIAASRNNDIGMNGVADNVRIMSLRAVPDGDERDKDVANSIIYAVDNGARIINMSFGKQYSYDKKLVDKAIKYATKKGVLLVHAAGNDGVNTDKVTFYPNDSENKKKLAKSWLEIGALSWKAGEDAVAPFSNYGSGSVDVFSPGVDIYSTTPDNNYDSYSGTSMAAPAAAGVAALVMSYYPKLTAQQVKQILLQSAISLDREVNAPGGGDSVRFSTLSQTGAVVNAYEAIKLAAKTKGKRKIRKPRA